MALGLFLDSLFCFNELVLYLLLTLYGLLAFTMFSGSLHAMYSAY